ncbi:UNVERIFIED_CONTAM: hypothetical protein K2H54_010296 [Gekko kuhli]
MDVIEAREKGSPPPQDPVITIMERLPPILRIKAKSKFTEKEEEKPRRLSNRVDVKILRQSLIPSPLPTPLDQPLSRENLFPMVETTPLCRCGSDALSMMGDYDLDRDLTDDDLDRDCSALMETMTDVDAGAHL